MTANGFTFANPVYSGDDATSYSAGQIEADAKIRATQTTEPIPAPRVNPPVMDLGAVLPAETIQAIVAAGKLVFHAVGDTGGIVQPEPQLAVADAMANDLANKTYADGRPAFFFHLGDVVYYFGQQEYYPEQFYDPYRNYDAPIFAVPGNHDGVMYKAEPVSYSLQPFFENFCSAAPIESAPGFSRTTMTQPGVYFVLTAPFARILGLYSNTGESVGVLTGGVVGTDQIAFLQQQLAAAKAARDADPNNQNPQALILAVHHPPFTGSNEHFPSAGMLAEIDQCCRQAGIWPDLVLSGHAHLYERYTRVMQADGRQIAYIVAGNGGYYDLMGMKSYGDNGPPAPGEITEPDGQGNTITLEQYNENDYGFLRITVSATAILVEALAVDPTEASQTPNLVDSFTIDLAAHKITTTTQQNPA